MKEKNSIRIDKFLWAVRLCKTRKTASNACLKRKIKINNIIIKPSKLVGYKDIIEYNKNNIFYKYEIIDLISNRISAKLVPQYINDITPEIELEKLKIKPYNKSYNI